MTAHTANLSDMFSEIHDETFSVLFNACRPLTCSDVCHSLRLAGCGFSYDDVRQALRDLVAARKVTVKPHRKFLRYTVR